jgi:protein-disulfide isomerase
VQTSAAGSCGGAVASTVVASLLGATPPGSPAGQLTIASFDGITQDGLRLGRSDAPLNIDLYQNFFCPHCQEFALQQLPLLIADYVAPGKATITFHDVAFNAGLADNPHEAAHCAADQDKFWQAYAVLYQNFSQDDATYAKTNLESLLSQTGVDATHFATCLDTDQHKAEVDAATDAFVHLGDTSPAYADALATITAQQGPAIPLIDVAGTYITAPDTYAPVKAAIDAKLAAR